MNPQKKVPIPLKNIVIDQNPTGLSARLYAADLNRATPVLRE